MEPGQRHLKLFIQERLKAMDTYRPTPSAGIACTGRRIMIQWAPRHKCSSSMIKAPRPQKPYVEVIAMKKTDTLKDLENEEETAPEFPHPARQVLAAFWRRGQPVLLLMLAVLLLCVIFLASALRSNRRQRRELQERLDLQNEILADMEQELDDANSLLQEAEPVITSETVSESIRAVRELVTKEYLYTNAGRYENHSEISISSITVGVPLTKKSFTVVYDGRVKAGLDLSKIWIDVQESARTVTVTLPASEITSHEIFEDSVRVVDEKDALFNRNTIDDYNDFLTRQKEEMEEKICSGGFLINADREAREIVRSALALLPGMDTYKLTVK